VKLNNGRARNGAQTALVVSPLDPDVSVLTPVSAPRVLDDPVWHLLEEDIGFDVITSDQDTVVELLVARNVEHTTNVELPFVSSNGNGDGTVLIQPGSMSSSLVEIMVQLLMVATTEVLLNWQVPSSAV